MSLTPEYFYHQTTRKMVVLFGTLFNNLTIKKPDGSDIVVPLTYSAKQKWYSVMMDKLTHTTAQGDIQKPEAMTLPRMAYILTSMSYDSARHCSSRNLVLQEEQSHPLARTRVFHPVPYNLSFDLYLASRTMEDGLQVIEQILPFFTPRLSVTFDELPEIGIDRDVEIVLTGISHNDEYLGDLSSGFTMYDWTLGFNLEANYYGPLRTKPIIRRVTTTVRPNPSTIADQVNVSAVPMTSGLDDIWEFEKNLVVVDFEEP